MSKNGINIFGKLTLWLPLILGWALTGVFVYVISYSNEQKLITHTNFIAESAADTIIESFELYEYGLQTTRALYASSEKNAITRDKFEAYITELDIENSFPGALGYGYIHRVSPELETSYLREIRADGAPEFTIRTLNEHNDDRFIIQYIYPIESNRQAQGLDIGSEHNRRAAATIAARLNQPQLTAPITLVQENQKPQRGILILLPIYQRDMPTSTPDAREKAVIGWSYAPLIVDDVMKGLSGLTEEATITLQSNSENLPFYTSASGALKADSTITKTKNIEVLGQKWKMTVALNRKGVANSNQTSIVLIIAITITMSLLLLSFTTFSRTNAIAQIEDQKSNQKFNTKISDYLTSKHTKEIWIATSIGVSTIFIAMSLLVFWSIIDSVNDELNETNDSVTSLLDNTVDKYTSDTLFLANSNPIKELTSGSSLPENDQTELTINQKERLEEIFISYLRSTKNVYQVRYLSADSGWQEIIKISRNNTDLKVHSQKELQIKATEKYVPNTLNLNSNQVHVSDIDLNIEFGQPEIPYKPVWRFSTPIYKETGDPLGIIIINVLAGPILEEVEYLSTDSQRIFITQNSDDFILHPDDTRTFALQKGFSYQLPDEFIESSGLENLLDRSKLQSYTSSLGNIWLITQPFVFDQGKYSREINIHTTYDKSVAFRKLSFYMLSIFSILISISVSAFLLQYWYWKETKRRQYESSLLLKQKQQEKNQSLFQSLLTSSPDATVIADSDGKILMSNQKAELFFGYTKDEMANLPLTSLFSEESESDFHFENQYNNIDKVSFRTKAKNNRSEYLPVEISTSSIEYDNKVLFSIALRDITDQLDREKKLGDAIETAQQATEAKSAFLANTSHEIRTPLNAVIGLSHMLMSEALSAKQRELVEKIKFSGQTLLSIINDVLDLSKIEANEMELQDNVFEIREFVESVFGIHRIQSKTKGLDSSLVVSDKVPALIKADKVRLKQIIDNLASNALKFTTSGSIGLFIYKSDAADSIRFEIKDSGIGIEEDAKNRLFQPFTQADSSISRKYGGTGLGLSIITKIIHLMNGRLGVESTLGKGSTFWFEIPILPISAAEIIEVQSPGSRIFSVIVDDSTVDAKNLVKETDSLDWRSEALSSGEELIKYLVERNNQNLRMPDVLLLDWDMPGLNGIDTMNSLNQVISRDSLPAVILVTGYDKYEIEKNTDTSCVDEIVKKPFVALDIFKVADKIISQKTGDSTRVLQGSAINALNASLLEGYLVLVVEDSELNQLVVSNILENYGASIVMVSSGEEAILHLTQSGAIYDVILMDIQMPGIDGLETTKRLRDNHILDNTPIIALTAGAFIDEQKRALDAGMADFLTKPIEPELLVSAIRAQAPTPIQGQPAPSGKPIEAQASIRPDEWPEIEGIEIAQAKQLLMNNIGLFTSTLRGVLTEHKNLAVPPSEMLNNKDQGEVKAALAAQIHKLKSSSGMVGARSVQEIASQTEVALRNDTTDYMALLTELAEHMAALTNNAAAFLQAPVANAPPVAGQVNIPSNILQAIIDKLKQRDLSVLDDIAEIRAIIFAELDPTAQQQFDTYESTLNFAAMADFFEQMITTDKESN